MENEASRRRECVVALRIREKREDVEEERKQERSGTSGDRDGSRKRHGGEGKLARETHKELRRDEAERKERQNRRNGSAGLSRSSFIFSPRLNIKDNLIIGGFSKADRPSCPLSSLRSSVLVSSSTLDPSVCRRCISETRRRQENSTQLNTTQHTYTHTHTCISFLATSCSRRTYVGIVRRYNIS